MSPGDIVKHGNRRYIILNIDPKNLSYAMCRRCDYGQTMTKARIKISELHHVDSGRLQI